MFRLLILSLLLPCLLFAQHRDTLVPVHSAMVYYNSNEYVLDTADIRELNYFLYVSKQLDTFIIQVNAHTDEVGNHQYNMDLSKNRAERIVAFFSSKDVPSEQILQTFSGETILAVPKDHSKNRRGEVVLYKPMKLIEVSGRVVDEETKEGIPATVTINDWIYKKQTQTDSLGRFSLAAPLGSQASISVSSPEYFMEGNMINIHKEIDKKPLTIPLPKIAIDKVYTFKNLNFVGNKAALLPHSYLPVIQLADFLKSRPDLCIETEGHVNFPSRDSAKTKSFQYDLSVARALKIKNELLDSEVDSSRILARGYANWRMKYPKPFTARQEAANRRVTIAIRSCEMVKAKGDDYVADLEKYEHDYLDWHYNPAEIERLFGKNIQAKLALFRGAHHVKIVGGNPKNFTYRELFKKSME